MPYVIFFDFSCHSLNVYVCGVFSLSLSLDLLTSDGLSLCVCV